MKKPHRPSPKTYRVFLIKGWITMARNLLIQAKAKNDVLQPAELTQLQTALNYISSVLNDYDKVSYYIEERTMR